MKIKAKCYICQVHIALNVIENRTVSIHNYKLHLAFHSKQKSKLESKKDLTAGENGLQADDIGIAATKNLKWYQCQVCPEKFQDKIKMKNHFQTHILEKSFQCPTCKKIFSSFEYLKCHKQIHGERKKYRCDLCELSFLYRVGFKRHFMKIHTTQRDFLCSECPRTFATSFEFYYHRRSHSIGKTLACTICSAKFENKYKLGRHIRSHGTTKEFACSSCSQQFKENYQLQAHKRRVHSGDKNKCKEPQKEFRCIICNRKFESQGKLKKHLSKAHDVAEMED